MDKKKIPYAVIAAVSFGLLFYMLFPFLDVVLFGIFMYYIARPVYRSLTDIIGSDTISAVVSLLFLVLPLILLFAYIASIATIELQNTFLSGAQTSNAINEIITLLSEFSKTVSYEELISLAKENQNVGSMIIDAVSGSLTIIFKIFLALVIAYYLLKDGHRLRSWVSSSFFDDETKIIEKFFNGVDLNLHQLFIGNILAAVITAIVGSIVFIIIGYFLLPPELSPGKYAILLGVLCGAANLLPGIGMKIIWVPLSIYFVAQAYSSGILFDSWLSILLSVAIIVIFVDWIPDLLVRPYVSGGDMHMGLILLAYVIGPWVFGFCGILLGPIVVVLAVNLCRILPEVRKILPANETSRL